MASSSTASLGHVTVGGAPCPVIESMDSLGKLSGLTIPSAAFLDLIISDLRCGAPFLRTEHLSMERHSVRRNLNSFASDVNTDDILPSDEFTGSFIFLECR